MTEFKNSSPQTNKPWHAPTDPKQIFPRLMIAFGRRRFSQRVLGTLPSGDEILAFQRPAPPGAPAVLVAAGFHGEEPGGPLGILHMLETAADPWLDGISLSIIPVLNPTGLRVAQRRNQWGENPNDGFCHPDIDPTPPSKEGRILLENLSLLKQMSGDLFLSLHEDGFPTAHAYAYGARPVSAANAALAEMVTFGITQDRTISENSAQLHGGLSLNHHDGSFEDRLHHEGVPICLVTETPRGANINVRAEVNDRIIRALLLHVRLQKAAKAKIENSKIHGLGTMAPRVIKTGEAIAAFSCDSMNHSCEPNVTLMRAGGLSVPIAVRDIGAGEEICHDYSITGASVPTRCCCGSRHCRSRNP